MLRYYMHDQAPALQQAQNEQNFHAIAGAGANLGRALEKLADEHKRTNTQAKAVESFFGAMSEEERSSVGLPPDMTQFKNLSAKDKIAAGQGIFQKQAFAQVGAQLREANQRIKAREAEATNLAGQPRLAAAFRRLRQPGVETMPPGVAGPPNQTRLPPPDALAGAVEETGFLPDSALGKLLGERGGSDSLFAPEELGRIRPTDYEGVGFMPTSRGGGQVVTNPNTPQRPGAPLQPRVVVRPNLLTQEPEVVWTGPMADFEKAFPHLAKPGTKGATPDAAPSGGAKVPKAGDVEDGYRFKGGDPADPKNWEKVK